MTAITSPGSGALDRAREVFGALVGGIADEVRAHRRGLLWLSPVLAVSAVVSFVNLGGSPQRIDDEGTYTAQAWAVLNYGELAHYTFWYDHPPLGWLQIAGYAQLTGAFARHDIAVLAGREAVVFASLIAAVIVWLLARRLGLGRPAAAVATLVFALSPLAVQFHRTVYLDNIAVPWLLAAFLFALSRRWQLAGFTASAACFGIAVLSKETFLLALPILAWVMWRSSQRETRRYTLAVAGSTLVLIGFGYILLALVKGELMPGENRVSLIDGVLFQLASRAGSGSPFDPDSLMTKTLSMWWQLDPVIIVAGLAAAAVALFSHRLRPFAVLVLGLTAFMFRPGGYLPVPYVIILLPFAAILIAGVTQAALRSIRERRRRVPSFAWAAIAAAALVAAVPLWGVQLRGLLLADLDAPMRQAENWVMQNVDLDDRLIVDDAMWVDLVQSGRERENVVWYYKIDTDPAVQAQSPNGWRDSDYIVTTDSMRTFPDSFPQVASAIENSVVVASFGAGTQAVEVRRILPQGIEQAEREAVDAAELRSQAGTELAGNPSLTVDTDAANLLTGGRVDVRIPLALAPALAERTIEVGGFPLLSGEDDQPRRQVLVTAVDGLPAVADGRMTDGARAVVDSLTDAYRPARVLALDEGLLLRFPVEAPAGLVQ